jgi:hypothetical protein
MQRAVILITKTSLTTVFTKFWATSGLTHQVPSPPFFLSNPVLGLKMLSPSSNYREEPAKLHSVVGPVDPKKRIWAQVLGKKLPRGAHQDRRLGVEGGSHCQGRVQGVHQEGAVGGFGGGQDTHHSSQ